MLNQWSMLFFCKQRDFSFKRKYPNFKSKNTFCSLNEMRLCREIERVGQGDPKSLYGM